MLRGCVCGHGPQVWNRLERKNNNAELEKLKKLAAEIRTKWKYTDLITHLYLQLVKAGAMNMNADDICMLMTSSRLQLVRARAAKDDAKGKCEDGVKLVNKFEKHLNQFDQENNFLSANLNAEKIRKVLQMLASAAQDAFAKLLKRKHVLLRDMDVCTFVDELALEEVIKKAKTEHIKQCAMQLDLALSCFERNAYIKQLKMAGLVVVSKPCAYRSCVSENCDQLMSLISAPCDRFEEEAERMGLKKQLQPCNDGFEDAPSTKFFSRD